MSALLSLFDYGAHILVYASLIVPLLVIAGVMIAQEWHNSSR
jgi:hypothetical protein